MSNADVIEEMRSESPTLGISMIIGRLRARGLKVSRDRLRRLFRESDPLSAALRWTGIATKHRPYSVAGPFGKCVFVFSLCLRVNC